MVEVQAWCSGGTYRKMHFAIAVSKGLRCSDLYDSRWGTTHPTLANSLSLFTNIIVLCGHYKGVDQRVRDHLITHEISIGDFVLSGGELAAAVLCDAIVRLIPGVLGDESSALTDSFQDGLLAPPIYTRPESYKGWKVPEILTSGNTLKLKPGAKPWP